MSDVLHLRGSGDAPLLATREYSFARVVEPADAARLTIPRRQRGSGDEHDLVEHPEQAVFVARLLAARGVTARSDAPGEWSFADPAALADAWAALTAAVRPPASATPTGRAQRSVSRAQASAVSAALTRRFLDLVSAVLGLSGEAFVQLDARIDNNGYESTRIERWRRGEVYVDIDASAIESGHGVHGERCDYIIRGAGDERDVRAYANIDMRSGGTLSVAVRGVLDAQALADRFVAPA